MEKVMLSFDKVSAHYGKIQALHEVSLHINQGEIVTLIGANGAGKTTLLGTLCGDPRATSGRIVFDDKDITDWQTAKIMREAVAIVPEGRRVLSRMTVEENLEMGAFTDPADMAKTMADVYERFPRLKERKRQLAGTLSGGEQQRVAVARALAHAPKLVIADEPTGNIDPELSLEMMELLERVSEMGITVLVVTHEHELVHRFHQRVVTLKNGRIISDIPADPEAIAARSAELNAWKELTEPVDDEPDGQNDETKEKEAATV